MSTLTYGHFYRTGIQDCGNACDPSSFDLDHGGTATEIVDHELNTWDRATWIKSWEGSFDELDPDVAWSQWLRGWREQAISYVESWLADRAERMLEE